MKYTRNLVRTTKNTKILIDVFSNVKYNSISRYVVENTNCPKEILVKVLRKGNSDDLSILAASHLNCPPEMLVEILKRGDDDLYISYAAARNPNCPPEVLAEILEKAFKNRRSSNVACGAAQNPNCPRETLKWMLMGKENRTSKMLTEAFDFEKHNHFCSYMLRNINFPINILKKILKKGKIDYVSYSAASNPNCPAKARINWMKKTKTNSVEIRMY
jgi:hypothetical protein